MLLRHSLCTVFSPFLHSRANATLAGGDADNTLISAKLESFALAPCLDASNPDDYFLITVAEKDFITTKGIALGEFGSRTASCSTTHQL